jgi:hypothetical protein
MCKRFARRKRRRRRVFEIFERAKSTLYVYAVYVQFFANVLYPCSYLLMHGTKLAQSLMHTVSLFSFFLFHQRAHRSAREGGNDFSRARRDLFTTTNLTVDHIHAKPVIIHASCSKQIKDIFKRANGSGGGSSYYNSSRASRIVSSVSTRSRKATRTFFSRILNSTAKAPRRALSR